MNTKDEDNGRPETSADLSQRKIIQIAAAGGDDYGTLYALCDDGTLWEECHTPRRWERVPSIPHDL